MGNRARADHELAEAAALMDVWSGSARTRCRRIDGIKPSYRYYVTNTGGRMCALAPLGERSQQWTQAPAAEKRAFYF
jgi:hypothetical protein